MEGSVNDKESKSALEKWISDFLDIPLAANFPDHEKNAVIVEFIVPEFLFGMDWALHSDPVIPIIWRPKITITLQARYRRLIGTKKLKYKVSKKSGWNEFLLDSLGLNYKFLGQTGEDIFLRLVGETLIELLERLKADISGK